MSQLFMSHPLCGSPSVSLIIAVFIPNCQPSLLDRSLQSRAATLSGISFFGEQFYCGTSRSGFPSGCVLSADTSSAERRKKRSNELASFGFEKKPGFISQIECICGASENTLIIGLEERKVRHSQFKSGFNTNAHRTKT